MKKRTLMLAGAGLAALALNSCGQKPAPAGTPAEGGSPAAGSAQSMRVTRVAARDLADRIEATGRLVVREEAAVGTELAGYRVQSVLVDEGDWVTRGQALARLDDTLQQAQIAQSKATLAQQKATADFKKSQLTRAEALTKEGAFSTAQLEQSRMEAASADAAYMSAQASLNEMEARQARMTIRAPVAGMILQRSLRPGEISSPATQAPYFRIARDGLVELDAELPDARLATVKEGDPVQVTLSAGVTINGKVRFVSPRVDQGTGLGKVRVELPFDKTLRPGGFAQAVFNGHAASGLAVPASAVRYEAGGPVVMVVDKDNKVVRTPVKLGARLGEVVQVLEGVPAGARVLTIGAAFVLDGETVQPVEEAVANASESSKGQQ